MLLKDLQTLATKLATGTLFHVEKAGKAYSVDYSALAKAIIEEYADSTVGGSKQSVQAAIGALNSSSMRYFPVAKIPQGADLDTIYSGNYFCNTNALHQSILHKPSGATTIWRLHVISITNDGESDPSTANTWMKRIQILEDENGVVFRRTIKGLGSASPVIGEWEKLPTRSEVDANTAAIAELKARVSALEGN